MNKTNVMRLLEAAKIPYDLLEYEVDENDLSGESTARNGWWESAPGIELFDAVNTAFPKAKIIEWKKKRSTQVVELTNDMELIFNLKGEFIRIDD